MVVRRQYRREKETRSYYDRRQDRDRRTRDREEDEDDRRSHRCGGKYLLLPQKYLASSF